MIKIWKKLKERWGISSDWQVGIILVVFTLTGTTTMYVHQLFNRWVGLDEGDSFWLKFLVFLLLVLPLYNGLLIVYGTILGQYRFFMSFIIRFFKSIIRLFTFPFRKARTKSNEL